MSTYIEQCGDRTIETHTHPQTTDFYVHGDGSIFLLCPQTAAAKEWLEEHCQADGEHSYLGRNLAVEHRYIQSIVELAQADGLTVS